MNIASYAARSSLVILLLPWTAMAEIEISGRLHLDYAAHAEDRRDLGDQFLLRRARLGIEGDIAPNWAYEFQLGFAENQVEAKNMYLEYTGWESTELTIGQSKIPFGLERETSSNDITFIERSLPTEAFAPGRRIGLVLEAGPNPWLAQAAVYGQDSDADVRETSATEGLGASGRVVFSPRVERVGQLHLGGALAVEQPENMDVREVEFRAYPESRAGGQRLVDTDGITDVRYLRRLVLEVAWQSGPYSVQWEYLRSDVDRRGGATDVGFEGWYVSGSWILTGESRRYDGGDFNAVRPERASGAWEIAARFSTIDLDDGPVQGGKQRNLTLGLNWYANAQIRFMNNLIFVDSNDAGGNDNPVILAGRMQLTF